MEDRNSKMIKKTSFVLKTTLTKKFLVLMMLMLVFSLDTFCLNGGEAFPVFNLPVSVRCAGMGNVSQAVGRGVFSTYSNNALIGYLDRKEIGFATMMLYYDTSLNYLGYFHPTLNSGNFAINVLNLNSGGAIEVDEYNVETGHTFSLNDTLINLGYGKEVYRQIYAGTSVKFINSTLQKYNNKFLLFDFGLLYHPDEKFVLGLSCNNVLNFVLTDTENRPNTQLKFGLSFSPIKKFLLGMDLYKNSSKNDFFDSYAFGGETELFDILKLRVGKNSNETTLGLGIEYKIKTFDLFLDYAFVFHEYLETSHKIGLSLKFGKTVDELWTSRMKLETQKAEVEVAEIKLQSEEERKKALQNLFDQAIKSYTNGNYTQALTKFKQVKEIDPKAYDIDIYIDRINVVVTIIEKIDPTKDKVSSLVAKGINYFINGDNVNSVKTLSYALSLRPEDKTVIRLLTSIEEKTGVRAEKIDLKSGLTLVDQKLNESLSAFNRKEYEKVISLCEDVLLLEPENALAYKRLGSALYALGDVNKAIQMWKKALVLDPKDNELKMLIEKIK
jgi:tetratricopeptide (TPR) repeat protein